MGMTYKEKIIDAFSKCIRITDEGYVQSDCEHCPNRTNDWGDAACRDFDELSVEVPWQLAKDMLDLVKEQEPKTPIHIHEEYPEHDWETDEDGKIDEWALDYEFHNGPVCKRCGYGFCMHCKPNGWNEKPCIIDYYQCPKCRTRIVKDAEKTRYCERCGQEIKWE